MASYDFAKIRARSQRDQLNGRRFVARDGSEIVVEQWQGVTVVGQFESNRTANVFDRLTRVLMYARWGSRGDWRGHLDKNGAGMADGQARGRFAVSVRTAYRPALFDEREGNVTESRFNPNRAATARLAGSAELAVDPTAWRRRGPCPPQGSPGPRSHGKTSNDLELNIDMAAQAGHNNDATRL
jgi:hypothetical protein